MFADGVDSRLVAPYPAPHRLDDSLAVRARVGSGKRSVAVAASTRPLKIHGFSPLAAAVVIPFPSVARTWGRVQRKRRWGPPCERRWETQVSAASAGGNWSGRAYKRYREPDTFGAGWIASQEARRAFGREAKASDVGGRIAPRVDFGRSQEKRRDQRACDDSTRSDDG